MTSSVPDSALASPATSIEDLLAGLGDDVESATEAVNGTRIHYVRCGAGPALVLIHGFPQDWFEWRRVMPRLAERFTVIAVDLRGVGGSAAPVVVGHDIGGLVAYAFARLHPDMTSGVVLMEMLLPDGATADIDGLVSGMGTVRSKVPSTPVPGRPHFRVHGRSAMGSVTVRYRYRLAGFRF